jgi:hypothetical protein
VRADKRCSWADHGSHEQKHCQVGGERAKRHRVVFEKGFRQLSRGLLTGGRCFLFRLMLVCLFPWTATSQTRKKKPIRPRQRSTWGPYTSREHLEKIGVFLSLRAQRGGGIEIRNESFVTNCVYKELIGERSKKIPQGETVRVELNDWHRGRNRRV